MGDLVKGLAWLGTRTDNYEELVSFWRDVLGMRLSHADAAMSVLELPDGSKVEVFGPRDDEHDFFTTGPVAGFLVEDVERARSYLEERGVGFIGPIHREGAMAWSHFRGPDGNVYEITQ